MEQEDAILALAALAQSTRLETFRLLVRHSPDGLPAGEIARALAIPHNTMSTHLNILSRVGLLSSERRSRVIVYRADVPRLRELMPALAAEGLTAERLALLAERVTRAEIAIYDVLNEALMRLAPRPWPEEGPVTVDAVAFGDLSEEIQLRMLDRLIGWTGNEGPVELGKLEVLCAALEEPLIDALMAPKPGPFRRTLAGAMVTLSGTKLTVERAPPRRTGVKKRRSARKSYSPSPARKT